MTDFPQTIGSEPTPARQESLADVTERMLARFESRIPLPTIARVVRRCRRELDVASGPGLPGMLESLAYQRLASLAPPWGNEISLAVILDEDGEALTRQHPPVAVDVRQVVRATSGKGVG